MNTTLESLDSGNPTNVASNFFSSGLRGKVDRLMDILWAGGVNNPMDSIEQLSYLIFLRLLSERDEQAALIEPSYKRVFEGEWAKYAWGNFVTLTGDDLFDTLRQAIEKLHELPGMTGTGKMLFRNATLKIYDRPTLRAVVQLLDSMDLSPQDGYDLKGDMYEYLLSKLSQSGTNGQFRTPRHIINMIVALVDPGPDQRICDPACGTAGFLISAYAHILWKYTKPSDRTRGLIDGSLLKPSQWTYLEQHAFTGYDNDSNMVKIAILNLYLHQLDQAQIEYFNPLTTTKRGQYPGQLYDIILANPPFSGQIQRESILSDINLDTRDTELLFMKWFIDHLSDEGRAGVVVPEGVVLGTDRASRRIRRLLLDENRLDAVIALPHSAFKPYASVATFVLVFRRGGKTERTWMYQLAADGFSQDSLRTPVAENDIPDLLSRWVQRENDDYAGVSGKHGWVSRDVIVEHDYGMAPRHYLSPHRSHHAFPTATIGELCSLEKGTTPAAKAEPGHFPLVTTAEELKTSSTYQFDGEGVCIPLVSSTGHGHASIKRLTYVAGRFAAATIIAVLQVHDHSKLLPQFLYAYLEANKDEVLVPLMKGAANVSLSLAKIASVRIPLPSLEEQEKFIADLIAIDGELAIIRRRIVELSERRQESLIDLQRRFHSLPE